MKNRIARDVPASEITPRELFYARRRFMQMAAGASAALLTSKALAGEKLIANRSTAYGLTDKLTPLEDVTHYNNFYEFGSSKEEPARQAGTLRTRPWTLRVEGEAQKPRTFDIDELLKLAPMEERIYRLRCVEAWSMVIPWLGFPLVELLKNRLPGAPTPYAKKQVALTLT